MREIRFGRAEFIYVENTIDYQSFEAAVDELAQDFDQVSVVRRYAGPMATPVFGDVAVVFALGALAGSFLSELGRDVYRGLRSALFDVYSRVKSWGNGRGYAPLALTATKPATEETTLHFKLPSGLDRNDFEAALRAIPDMIDQYAGNSPLVGLAFKDGKWVVVGEAGYRHEASQPEVAPS